MPTSGGPRALRARFALAETLDISLGTVERIHWSISASAQWFATAQSHLLATSGTVYLALGAAARSALGESIII